MPTGRETGQLEQILGVVRDVGRPIIERTKRFPQERAMSADAKSIQQKVHELAEQLPEGATWEDVIEEVRFRRAIEAGVAAADRGAFASDGDVRAAFARWGVKV